MDLCRRTIRQQVGNYYYYYYFYYYYYIIIRWGRPTLRGGGWRSSTCPRPSGNTCSSRTDDRDLTPHTNTVITVIWYNWSDQWYAGASCVLSSFKLSWILPLWGQPLILIPPGLKSTYFWPLQWIAASWRNLQIIKISFLYFLVQLECVKFYMAPTGKLEG